MKFQIPCHRPFGSPLLHYAMPTLGLSLSGYGISGSGLRVYACFGLEVEVWGLGCYGLRLGLAA